VKDEFQTDWATSTEVSVPAPEVADVSDSTLNLLLVHSVCHSKYITLHTVFSEK